jgi:hypothetical protein
LDNIRVSDYGRSARHWADSKSKLCIRRPGGPRSPYSSNYLRI